MIFPDEVNEILNDAMPPSLIPDAVEHYTLGGFHTGVEVKQREAFIAWLNDRSSLPDQMAALVVQSEQLDMLEV